MPLIVTNGAMIACNFGSMPSNLVVLPVNGVTAGGMTRASIMDHAPLINITPFGMCNSPANPTVAAATAAAVGVVTQMPCVPATPFP